MLDNSGEQCACDAVNSIDVGTAINADENFKIEKIIGFDALYDSMFKCKRGVMWKDSVVSYVLNGIEHTLKLEKELHNGKYKSRPPKYFVITSPKKREIISVTFRDRVFQRSQNDNVIYPLIVKSFIWDNMACQRDKGTDRARERLKCFMQRSWRKYSTKTYVLQIDVRGYYPHMRHDVALRKFAKSLPSKVVEMIKTTFREQYKGEIGFNPGSQLIQIAGISVLDDLDHYIKEVLHIKYFIRYMDDLILIHDDKEHLQYCKVKIGEKLNSIGFEYNPVKTKIYPVTKGIMFLGFTFKLTDTGKVLMLLNSKNVKNERRKLRHLVALAKLGERTKTKVDECYRAWRNHASKGNCFNLLQRMDKFYKDLWGDKNGTTQENQRKHC